MKQLNKSITITLLLLFANYAYGQDSLQLSHDEFISIVKRYHPLAQRYQLQLRIAESEIMQARGNFDPVLEGKRGSKTIDKVDYYDQSTVDLTIPSWYGIEINTGYEKLEGQRLDNSSTVGGLYQAGVTVPLAKNLLYDRRRAVLEQAKYGRAMTMAEQQLLTNDLLMEAATIYWDWVRAYQVYRLQQQLVVVNRNRLGMIRKTFEFGERAAIDTTEALSQLQSFELQAGDAGLSFFKATQELLVFLWKENAQPFDPAKPLMPSDTLGSSGDEKEYASLIDLIRQQSLQQHAAIRFYAQKNNILQSERKLKFQSLLPRIDLTYNFLGKQNYTAKLFPLFENNYQYGIKVGFPVFLRTARAEYRMIKTKIMQNQLDAAYKEQELKTKLNSSINEVINYRAQIEVASRVLNNYKLLLKAEEQRFLNGESSVFLINARENKVLEAEQKLLEFRIKFTNAVNRLKWMNANFYAEN